MRDRVQVRQDVAALKQRWKEFSSAVKNKDTECFCAWVQVPEARNWKAPKFWDNLRYCKKHGKMGARLGKPQKRRTQPKRTVIIDLGNSSDEELFDIGVQNLAPQGCDVTDLEGNGNGTVSQKIHREIEHTTRKPRYTAETIACDILRAAGIHPTQPPLNWNRDYRFWTYKFDPKRFRTPARRRICFELTAPRVSVDESIPRVFAESEYHHKQQTARKSRARLVN